MTTREPDSDPKPDTDLTANELDLVVGGTSTVSAGVTISQEEKSKRPSTVGREEQRKSPIDLDISIRTP